MIRLSEYSAEERRIIMGHKANEPANQSPLDTLTELLAGSIFRAIREAASSGNSTPAEPGLLLDSWQREVSEVLLAAQEVGRRGAREEGRRIIAGGKMAEPNERDKQLAQSAIDGEGLGPEVLDRIERAVARGREEAGHHDAHVIEKHRHGGDRDGETVFYAVGPVRSGPLAREEATLDAYNLTFVCHHLTECQALSRGQAKRIAELEQALSNEEQHLSHSGNRIADLEAKIARWRPIARAAVLETKLERTLRAGQQSTLRSLQRDRRNAVDALSEQERSELLKEAENG